MNVTGKLLVSLIISLTLSGCNGSVSKDPSFSSVYKFVDYEDVTGDSYVNAVTNFISDMCYGKQIERYCDCIDDNQACLEIPQIVEALE